MADVIPNATEGADTGSSVSTFQENVLQIIYVVIGVIGFAGNLFMVGVLVSNKSIRQKVTNVYLINQGMLDALSCILIAAFALTATDGAHLSGYADDLLCRLWLTRFPIWSMVMNSTYSLLALTIDRYFRIVRPVQYKNHFTKRLLIGAIVSTWLIGPLYNISWKWPSSGIVDGQCLAFAIWPNDMTASIVGVLTIFLQYCLPLFVLIFCYAKIIMAIRQRIKPKQDVVVSAVSNPGAQQAKPAAQKQDNFERAKNNIIKTLVMVALCFVLCWTWNEVFIFLYFIGYPTDFGSTFYHFTVVAVFSNSCINPFIYCAKYEDFRVALRELFCKNQKRASESEATRVVDLDN